MESLYNKNDGSSVWVFIERNDSEIARVSIELLSKGRELADKLNVSLAGFVIGDHVSELADEIIFNGADIVYVAEDKSLKDYNTEVYADIISEQVNKEKPEIFILGATPIGRDLAPRLSFRLKTGCTADCTNLDIDIEQRLLVSTRPAFGGNVMATIICPEHRPQMSTVRAGVMSLPNRDETRIGKIENINVNINADDVRVKILESVKIKSETSNIQDAERLVGIGIGAEDEEGINRIKEMADLLKAQIGASRLAVEAGWFSHDIQIGQTGKTVRPDLYIACGISGAVQHTAGMSGAKLIIAINNDPNAEIFNIADYGIVGDLKEVVPAITDALNKI